MAPSVSSSSGNAPSSNGRDTNRNGVSVAKEQKKLSCGVQCVSFTRPENEEGSGKQNPLTRTRKQTKRWTYKNVYGLGVSFFIVFTAFIGLQNLQSSINSSGGLGLASLAVVYSFFIISGFVTPSILKLFGTKYSLLIGWLCHLQYTIANYYPSWYTLIPSSAIIGFGSGPIWAAASSHFVEIAILVAPKLDKDKAYLISKFTGILFFFFQCSQIPGNLASSLILFPYNKDEMPLNETGHAENATNFERDSCDINESTFDRKFLYILVSLYAIFIVVGIIVLLVFVDHLPLDNSFFSTKKKVEVYLKEPLHEIFLVFKDIKMILLAPMSIVNGLEQSFAFGTFTEVCILSMEKIQIHAKVCMLYMHTY